MAAAIGATAFNVGSALAAEYGPQLVEEYGPQMLDLVTKYGLQAFKKIGRGIAINRQHRANRRLCGYSKAQYRAKGGYKSRIPLCMRECYKRQGHCLFE